MKPKERKNVNSFLHIRCHSKKEQDYRTDRRKKDSRVSKFLTVCFLPEFPYQKLRLYSQVYEIQKKYPRYNKYSKGK